MAIHPQQSRGADGNGLTNRSLSAVILVAGVLTSNRQAVTVSLAICVAAGSCFSGAFVYFVLKYAGLRR